MKQRLAIAQAIMEEPELIILDEPFNGLDESGVTDVRNILLNLKREGKTIILTSHNADDINLLCDKVYQLQAGRIL
ncbi:ATP-binding cassette domain-containing protein [Garciella nitratireducens]|uniref:ABC transporter n=1 Tax=Garciella nitratireducens DSM 15102 TaxID=1121911 RepID=A0A1T4M7N4_9FIRM|nr:ABC transporter [Garciella nitratireducens DSM 15102]